MFKFPTKAKDEFMSHISVEVLAIVSNNKKLSLHRYEKLYLDSYEQKYIEPYLSDEALIWKIENAIKNAKRLGIYELPRHYDEYLSTDGIAELLKRFKGKV